MFLLVKKRPYHFHHYMTYRLKNFGSKKYIGLFIIRLKKYNWRKYIRMEKTFIIQYKDKNLPFYTANLIILMRSLAVKRSIFQNSKLLTKKETLWMTFHFERCQMAGFYVSKYEMANLLLVLWLSKHTLH